MFDSVIGVRMDLVSFLVCELSAMALGLLDAMLDPSL